MTLYETIFVRRSVRKYDMTPLDEKTLADIGAFLDAADRMPGQTARFEIAPAGSVKGMQAPHYILAYCGVDAGACANAGYVLGGCDLYIQSLGLGSVFLGMAKPIQKSDDYRIMLAFGKSDAPLRAGEGDFSRLPLHEISAEDNPVIRAARLAPSAMNSQPWKFECADGLVAVRYFGRGLTKLLIRNMNKIDVGIASRHAAVALRESGKDVISVTPKADGKELAVEIRYK